MEGLLNDDIERMSSIMNEERGSSEILPIGMQLPVELLGGGNSIRVVVLSDTHNMHERLTVPPGDVLIHCGDFTNKATLDEIKAFDKWFGTLPHKHKLFVLGNHEVGMFSEWDPKHMTSAIFLDNKGVNIDGISFYGASWQGELTAARHLPSNTDVFFTHEPPLGVLDEGHRGPCGNGAILELVMKKQPRVALFGHVHTAHGCQVKDGIVFANCSSCSNSGFRAKAIKNQPVWFDIDPR